MAHHTTDASELRRKFREMLRTPEVKRPPAVDALLVARVLVCAFFAACFLQSGCDKVVDWKGNLAWLMGHFEKTPLRGMVALMLGVVTVLELAAGFACLAGVPSLLANGPAWIPLLGLGLVGLVLTMLFAGQRIAKDYPGAATIATYFAVDLIGLWLLKG